MSFDPQSFLEATFTESNSTTLEPVQPGEYHATVKSVDLKTGEKDGRPWASLNLAFTIDDPVVQEELKRIPTVYHRVFLDLNDQGGLDTKKGRNIRLGQIREAFNLNQPGEAFSLKMFEGRSAKVRVDHKIWNDQPQAEVTAVVKQ